MDARSILTCIPTWCEVHAIHVEPLGFRSMAKCDSVLFYTVFAKIVGFIAFLQSNSLYEKILLNSFESLQFFRHAVINFIYSFFCHSNEKLSNYIKTFPRSIITIIWLKCSDHGSWVYLFEDPRRVENVVIDRLTAESHVRISSCTLKKLLVGIGDV